MEFKTLNLDDSNITSHEVFEVIEENHSVFSKMSNEIKKLKNINSRNFVKIESLQSNHSNITENNSSEINTDLLEEVDYYYNLLTSLSMKDFSKEKLIRVLPRRDNVNYNNIIFSIKLEILKEIKTIQDVIEDDSYALDVDDLNDFKTELEFHLNKIKLIDEISNEENMDDLELKENNFIFIPTLYENIRVIGEIEKIAKNNPEHIEDFKMLFTSITEGTFKGVKRFNRTNNRTSGVSEVRNYQSRIVFDKIGEYDYAIITAFIKKSNNDKGYLESLENKIKYYFQIRDEVIKKLDDEDFQKENKEYTNLLTTILDNNIKVKKKV